MNRKKKVEYNTGDKVVIGGLSPCFFQQSGVVKVESYPWREIAVMNDRPIDELNTFKEEDFLQRSEGYTIEELKDIQQYFANIFEWESYPEHVKIYPLPKGFVAEVCDYYDQEFSLECLENIKKHFEACEVKIGIKILSDYDDMEVQTYIMVEKGTTK